MKTLVIAEKPSAANDIRKGLEAYGSFKKLDWAFESDQYVITWLVGHVLSLKEPKEYENWGGKWSLDILPWFPPDNVYEYKENGKTRDVFKKVSAYMKRSDIGLIINACDAEREGDLIFWEIYDYLKLTTPVKRFWESASLTPKVVQRVMEEDLKEESFFGPRREAAYARAFADLLLGMNFTVGFTSKANTLLHMGRVQTPTIAILAQRKKEIDAFREEPYFELDAHFKNKAGTYKGKWFKGQLGDVRFEKKEDAEAILSRIQGGDGTVTKKEVKKELEQHRLLYSLTTLQQDANTKFGFTASQTLELAQALYETHKILSYPRSESEVLGSEHVKQLEPVLRAINLPPYDAFVEQILSRGIKTTDRFINDKKLTDHHAIIPTEVKPDLSRLSKDEARIYDLVAKRYLSVFYPAAEYEKTEIVTEVKGETFKTSGKIEIDPGWKVVYGKEADLDEDEKKEKEEKLPMIEKNEVNQVEKLDLQSKKTSPPKHYNERTLLGAMKNPKRFLEDKELQDAMASAEAGLGTPATRAAIIENIVQRGYVERKGKQLIATELGQKLIEICPEGLKSPEITADWEQKLRDVSNGELTKDAFMQEIEQYIQDNIQDLRAATLTVDFRQIKNDEVKIGVCPTCQSDVVERNNVFSCVKNTKEAPCFVIFKKIAGKTLTTKQAKQLLEEKKTAVIKGFVSSKKKKFDAMLVIKEGKVEFQFPTGETGLSCPLCQGAVIERDKVYFCENNSKESPCLAIFKTVAGKKLTATHVKQLLEKGETGTIEGFTSTSGSKFSAKLRLEAGRIKFKMEERKELSVACPKCGGKIVENSKAFGCSNWKTKNCSFTIWKVVSGKTLNEAVVHELIQKRKTEQKLTGFKNKEGKKFEAFLELNDAGKVVFSFE